MIIFSVYFPTRSGCTDHFKSVMDELDACLSLFPSETVIFAGDFNADPGLVGETDSSLPTRLPNEQGAILNRYLAIWGYVSGHLHLFEGSQCSGPPDTYTSEAHGSSSCIDHILCHLSICDKLLDCLVLDDAPLNVSNRLPVVAEFSILPVVTNSSRFSVRVDPSNRRRPNWKRCSHTDLNDYREAVSRLLPTIPDSWDRQAVDRIVKDISESLRVAASRSLPIVSFRKYAKPGWNIELKLTHFKCKQPYRAWRINGRPSDPSNPFRRSYKEAKRVFRRALRRFKRQEFDTFLNSLDLDSRKLFRQLRMRNGSSPISTSSILVDNQSFSGADVVEGWASYFESLASTISSGFCPTNSCLVEEAVLSIFSKGPSNSAPVVITNNLVKVALDSISSMS